MSADARRHHHAGRWSVAAPIALAALVACAERPPFVLLGIEDAQGAAAGFAAIYVGLAPEHLASVAVSHSTLPLTVTVTRASPGEAELWAEARAEDGTALARGHTLATFARRGSPRATVQLNPACAGHGDCNDGTFCDSPIRCVDGGCVRLGLPCVSAFDCVITTCVELGGGDGTCDVTVDHSRCAAGSYCDTTGGCAPGRPCMPENLGADCDDGLACNGLEVCNRYRCEGGAVVGLDDGDSCTLDGCNDALSPPDGPIFHLALSRNDGLSCTTAGGSSGVCVAAEGGCAACDVVERCGPQCVPCTPAEPICIGSETGCQCELEPSPHGSCGRGNRCVAGGCQPCAETTHCGPACTACAAPTSLCGGPQAGCVVPSCTGQPDFTPCLLVTEPDRWYDICVAGACVSPGCGDRACNPPGPGYLRADVEAGWVLPDTGQLACHNATAVGPCSAMPCAADGGPAFCGQDAQYGWDVGHPDPSLRWTRVSSDEPTVIDGLTGLVWQGCLAGHGGADCSRGERPRLASWRHALAYCNDLTWAGHHDWRLPDVFEIDLVEVERAGVIDALLIPRADRSPLWTSTAFGDDAGLAFLGGTISESTKDTDSGQTMLCVRDGAGRRPWGGGPRFERSEPVVGSGQWVVHDRRASLIWQGCLAGYTGPDCANGAVQLLTWEAALRLCESLDWGGLSDWRLPNIAEYQSILDVRGVGMSLDPIAFPGGTTVPSWTSTSLVVAPTIAHAVLESPYVPFTVVKSASVGARCVRDGP